MTEHLLKDPLTIAGKKFRMAHIDVDIYQGAKETFHWLWPRLLPPPLVIFFYLLSQI